MSTVPQRPEPEASADTSMDPAFAALMLLAVTILGVTLLAFLLGVVSVAVAEVFEAGQEVWR